MASSALSASTASLPLEKSLIATQTEVGAAQAVHGPPSLARILPTDRGRHGISGTREGGGAEPVCTQKAADKQSSQLTQSTQPAAAHTISITQTAQAPDPARQGTAETDGNILSPCAGQAAHVAGSRLVPQGVAAEAAPLGQSGASGVLPSTPPTLAVRIGANARK